MTQNSNLLGVILAGGLSKRMNKENKFFKTLNKKTLLEIIINKAVSQIPKLVINIVKKIFVENLIQESQIEKKLDLMIDLLEDVLLELRKSPRDSKRWMTCAELAEGMGISERTIYRLRKDGVFKEGKDFRRKIPDNPRSSLIYNRESCEKAYFLVTSGRRLEIAP